MNWIVHVGICLGSAAFTAVAGFCVLWLLFRSRDWTDWGGA